jgi:hypothetical protein
MTSQTIAIVMGDDNPAEIYRKLNARRYYADLNARVFYFKVTSHYWLRFLTRLDPDVQLVALNDEVSAVLTRHNLVHTIFNGPTIHNYIKEQV